MILDFIKSNWLSLVSILLLIVTFVFSLVRKKASLNLCDSIKASLSEVIPGFILLAEKSGVSGPEKLTFVVQLALQQVTKELGVSLSITQTEYWTTFISQKVEAILATPQKKG